MGRTSIGHAIYWIVFAYLREQSSPRAEVFHGKIMELREFSTA